MDEAKRYYETAVQMDPGNAEYQRALDMMERTRQRRTAPTGTGMCRHRQLRRRQLHQPLRCLLPA